MALMEESKISADKPIPMADAVRYRDGLMIALLAQVPLRPRNSAELEIDRDVIKEGDNWSIVISPDDTKTRTLSRFRNSRVYSRQFCHLSCPRTPQDASSFRVPGPLANLADGFAVYGYSVSQTSKCRHALMLGSVSFSHRVMSMAAYFGVLGSAAIRSRRRC
jgi:hypothetical protein